MVSSVTGYGRSGLHDYVIQRVTSVVLAVYTIYLLGFIICTPELTYEIWSGLFDQLWMRIFSLLALISIAAHARIGLWTVVTDYVTERLMGPKALVFRIVILSTYTLIIIALLIWGVEILWG